MSCLYLVTVPIGNIKDITQNALEALKNGIFFAVEDTRSFKNLLNILGISQEHKKIFSFHDHSSGDKVEKLLNIIRDNHILYLVSEAGSPIISDPAYPIVKKAIEEEISVKSYSGISSVVNALEISGMPPCPFHFYGFLSRGKSNIESFSEQIRDVPGTHIFFESPHRLDKTLEILSNLFLENDICVCRELTKKFESIYRFRGNDYSKIRDNIILKGEFVVLIHITQENDLNWNILDIQEKAREILEKGSKAKSVAKLIGKILNENPKDIYDKLKNIKSKD